MERRMEAKGEYGRNGAQLREDDESDEPNPGKPDLLSLLRDIVSPFLS